MIKLEKICFLFGWHFLQNLYNQMVLNPFQSALAMFTKVVFVAGGFSTIYNEIYDDGNGLLSKWDC